jgi:hypothetical protein
MELGELVSSEVELTQLWHSSECFK